MARKRRGQAASPWDADAQVSRERDFVTDREARLDRRARKWRWVIIACLVLMPVCVVGSLSVLQRVDTDPNADAVSFAQMSAPGRDVAQRAVDVWLSDVSNPIPGGVVASWDGARKLDVYVPRSEEAKLEKGEVQDRWVHDFTVRRDGGQAQSGAQSGDSVVPVGTDGQVVGELYRVSQLVKCSGAGGCVTVGMPSVVPLPGQDASVSDGLASWPWSKNAQAPAPVVDAVGAWVDAFTSGDSTKLRVQVADPDSSHEFVPLSGVVAVQWQIVESAYRFGADGFDQAPDSSDEMIVRVRLSVDRGVRDEHGDPVLAPMDMDVLVVGAKSAPRVVAWGGVGTGYELKAFENATVKGRVH